MTTEKINGKTNYFYIDEAGNILNDSKVFIHGCIMTDTPHTISDALKKLKADQLDNIYYEGLRDKILSQGFHATANHPDVRADVYKLISLLEYRAYFVITDKRSEYFKEALKNKSEHEIFQMSVQKLLKDRIIKNQGSKNVFVFEQLEISKKSLNSILTEFFGSLEKKHDCEFLIRGKEEENLCIVDYLNYIFFQLLDSDKPTDRAKWNFEMVQPKIAVINLFDKKVYLSRKKKLNFRVNLENLLRESSGKSG